MTYSLAGAFAPVRNSLQFVGSLYDHAGFLAMRALIDGRVMDINEDRITSPTLKKVARLYNEANDVFQDKLFIGISQTYAGGNLGPKPDFKKPILNLGGVVLNNFGRMNLGQVAILTLAVGVAMAATYLSPDTASNLISIKPNSSPQLQMK